MKELEKTKRISIASTLFILAILIGLLTYKRPKDTYAINVNQTLEKITNDHFFVTLESINTPDYVLIDIRSQNEFDKGHLENAINVHTPDILNKANSALFKELKESNKIGVLYGYTPQEANVPFMFLYQLGYDNLKLLTIKNNYSQNKLITKTCDIEKLEADISAFINQSVKNSKVKEIPKRITRPVKKIIPVRKKKKKVPEGGC
ncbi:rhodanese-like domain-containing protein [Flavivirga spongiicola]|uniref:Rhodanese-like domain-containing protein n=1 Tax=Flavivirga spongiicola TaxID=421621 RepID=A0ABU7XZN2_9FLAO|nr:rhodanese-like domain-containing protein [Flavivirga sp. MEBiC05379]MDO5981047.1 rhodanese-like domain-containing protein [Flavivirga sp. MEBiC05379]